jgi:hypothetical protein
MHLVWGQEGDPEVGFSLDGLLVLLSEVGYGAS